MANEWLRKSYGGGAVATTLNGAISGVATAIVLTNGSTYPDGTGGPFIICLDRGLPAEEKIICSARSGNNVTALQRGYDGTAAVAHNNLAVVEHVLDAFSIDQANAMSAAATTVGDIPVRSAAFGYSRVVPGTTGVPLISQGAGVVPVFGQIAAAGVSAAAIAAINAGLLKADGSVQASALLSYASALNPVAANDIPRKGYVDAQVAALAADPTRFGCGAFRNAQSIPTATPMFVTFDTILWNTGTYLAVPSLGPVVQFPGVHVISLQCNWGLVDNPRAAIFLNGALLTILPGVGTDPDNTLLGHTGTIVLNCNAGDGIAARVQQSSGGAMNVNCRLSLARVSA